MRNVIFEQSFTSFADRVERFESLDSNLSDTETIFKIIKEFKSLKRLSMHNDQLKFIPSYAFDHEQLSDIWFGIETMDKTQPIEYIGDYAFYNLPKVNFIRIFSPKLSKIGKYSFAQRTRYDLRNNSISALHLYIGGESLNSDSFERTSLTRFRSRPVFLRFYKTKMFFLDENIFQPFLEMHPYSAIDTFYMNDETSCDCRSQWIQRDYLRNIDQLDNRVYGYKCWDYDFSDNCTMNKLI